jgi:hypothetical protein
LETISIANLKAFVEVDEKSTGTNISFIYSHLFDLEYLLTMSNKKWGFQLFLLLQYTIPGFQSIS